MEIQWSQNSQTFLKKKYKVGGLTLANYKTYYKATLIKTVYICKQQKQSTE